MLRALTLFSIFFAVGLLAIFFSLREADRRELAQLMGDFGSSEVLTFRLELGVTQAPNWTPTALNDLEQINGVEHVEWRGGTLISQHLTNNHVVPIREVSSGLLELVGRIPSAGRTLGTADESESSIVIGTEMAKTLFGESLLDDYIGKRVNIGGESFQVVGLFDGLGAAYKATPEPAERGGAESSASKPFSLWSIP